MSAKLVLVKRTADGSDRTRRICDKYKLSDTAAAELIAGHHRRFGEVEARAQKEVQALEYSLLALILRNE